MAVAVGLGTDDAAGLTVDKGTEEAVTLFVAL